MQEVDSLNQLASVPDAQGAGPSMEAMNDTAQATAPAGTQPGQSPAQGEQQKMDQVGKLFQQATNVMHEITQVDPRTTLLVKESIEKLYLQLSRLYGVEEETKLAMKKASMSQQNSNMQRGAGMEGQ